MAFTSLLGDAAAGVRALGEVLLPGGLLALTMLAGEARPRRGSPGQPPCATWRARCRPAGIAPSCSGEGRTLCGGRLLVLRAASL
jgi:hypothetical protein